MLPRIFRHYPRLTSATRTPRITSQSPKRNPIDIGKALNQPTIECKFSPAEVVTYSRHFNALKVSNMLFAGVQVWLGFSLFSEFDAYSKLQIFGLMSAADNIIFGSLGPFWNKTIVSATEPIEEIRLSDSKLKTNSLVMPYVVPALIQFGFASSYLSICGLYLARYSHQRNRDDHFYDQHARAATLETGGLQSQIPNSPAQGAHTADGFILGMEMNRLVVRLISYFDVGIVLVGLILFW
jgi:hypothetical protein